MSSYLLLRNNKETGPFTIDEIKGMSLKPYDLLWIVGKSAAWRYPGEINEIKSFAPPVPDQVTDFSKVKNGNAENTALWETNTQSVTPARSVYVNLPSEKRHSTIQQSGLLFERDFLVPEKQEAAYEYTQIYKKPPTPTILVSGKILWVSTIVLLFGAGLLTGFFISDRRKYFSTDAIHPQSGNPSQPVQLTNKKIILPVINENIQDKQRHATVFPATDSVKHAGSVARKSVSGIGKKNVKNTVIKKDSTVVHSTELSSVKLNDSINQTAISKTELLYQKMRARPENYVNLVTGRYSTGVFGGISSFSVSVTNNSPVIMNLVVVSIDYVQNNEKIFKTETLSFTDLEPGETVTMKAPKSPRGTKITTHIQLFNSRQPDQGNSN
jgi:hypothetical protein